MDFKVGDKVKVLLVKGGNFNDADDYEVGVIKHTSTFFGYFIEFDDKTFSSCYYDKEELQKIDEYMNCDVITDISEIILKLKELEKKVFKLENVDDINWNEIDWKKINDMSFPYIGGDTNAK